MCNKFVFNIIMKNKYKLLFLFTFLLIGIFFTISYVSADYNFEVTDISTSPSDPVDGQECLITVKIKTLNEDPLVSTAGINDYDYDFDDYEKVDVALPEISESSPIEQGETFQYVFTGVFLDIGTKDLYFSFNDNQGYPESIFANNDRREQVSVISKYDLAVTSIDITPENPSPYQKVKVTIQIKNMLQI